jgi:hypothetical protein
MKALRYRQAERGREMTFVPVCEKKGRPRMLIEGGQEFTEDIRRKLLQERTSMRLGDFARGPGVRSIL